jgi:hypothetical protein
MPPVTKALGPVAQSLLGKRRPRRKPRKDLAALLAKAEVPGHAGAVAFDADYGGIVFDPADEPYLVGAAACLASGAEVVKLGKKKLVPVVCTPNDNIYFVDERGAAYGQDTIEDEQPVAVAANGRAMLTRLLLQEHVFYCPEEKKVTLPGMQGKKLGLPKLDDASDTGEKWWSDGKVFVVERGGETEVAYPSKAVLAAAGVEAPKAEALPERVTFANVMKTGVCVSLVSTVDGTPGKPAALLAAFLDPKQHAAGSTIARGGAFSFAGGKIKGKVELVEEDNRDELHVRLTAEPIAGFTKAPTRVEIFFRDGMINLYHFDAPWKRAEAVQSLWWDGVLGVWGPLAKR